MDISTIDNLINQLLESVRELDNSRTALECSIMSDIAHSSYTQEDIVKNWLRLENINGQKVAHLEIIKKLKWIKELEMQAIENNALIEDAIAQSPSSQNPAEAKSETIKPAEPYDPNRVFTQLLSNKTENSCSDDVSKLFWPTPDWSDDVAIELALYNSSKDPMRFKIH